MEALPGRGGGEAVGGVSAVWGKDSLSIDKENEKVKDYFKFLEELTTGEEVLTTSHGDRIYTVTGITGSKIALSDGRIYDKETGEQVTGRKKDASSSILELTKENKKQIAETAKLREAKREQDQKDALVHEEFGQLTGIDYRSKKPSTDNQKKIIEFIKSLG